MKVFVPRRHVDTIYCHDFGSFWCANARVDVKYGHVVTVDFVASIVFCSRVASLVAEVQRKKPARQSLNDERVTCTVDGAERLCSTIRIRSAREGYCAAQGEAEMIANASDLSFIVFAVL